MADGKDILILAEHSGGSLDSSVGELAAAAKGLAEQTGGQVVAALCGSGASGLAQEIAALGRRCTRSTMRFSRMLARRRR